MLEQVLMPGVRLRLFEEADADELYRLIEDNRAFGAAVDNARSCAVPERLGFTREGVLRQLVQVGGRRQDISLHAVLAEEWRRAGATP